MQNVMYRRKKEKKTVVFPTKLYEAGLKLHMDMERIFLATMIYHRACKELKFSNTDEMGYVVAAASLYVVGKIRGPVRTYEDLAIIFYRIMGLEEGNTFTPEGGIYADFKEDVEMMELLIIRALGINIHKPIPSDFLLSYVYRMYQLLPAVEIRNFNIARSCWTLLSDFMSCDACADFEASHTAIAIIYCVLNTCGINVPGCSFQDWAEKLHPGVTREQVEPVIQAIVTQYEKYK